MRPWLLVLLLLTLAVCLSSSAVADEAALLSSPPPTPAAWEIPMSCPLPSATVSQPPKLDPLFAVGRDQWFDLELLIGLPTGVRFGVAAYRHNSFAFLVEGMAGLEVIFPMAGVGGRFRFTPFYGERNALVLKPGVDVYALVGWDLLGGSTTTVTLWGADVECLWFHNCGCCGWNLGIDLGALVSERTGRGLPFVSLIGGLRF